MESEKFIYIATEYVTPLSTYLENITDIEESSMAISWCLHQVVNGLSFLINQGLYRHPSFTTDTTEKMGFSRKVFFSEPYSQ